MSLTQNHVLSLTVIVWCHQIFQLAYGTALQYGFPGDLVKGTETHVDGELLGYHPPFLLIYETWETHISSLQVWGMP